MKPPSETGLQPVPGHDGWFWWRRRRDGLVYARRGRTAVRAHNFTALLAKIRKMEGISVDQQIAELEHLFPGSGWVFGKVWQSVQSGPDKRNLTAQRDGVLLAAPDVPSLAEKIRHEEGR